MYYSGTLTLLWLTNNAVQGVANGYDKLELGKLRIAAWSQHLAYGNDHSPFATAETLG